MLYNCHQRSDNSYTMSDVYQQLYYSCYQTSGLRARIHAFSCFHWKRFDFKVCLWGRKVTSTTFNKRVPGRHKFVYCTRIIWCTAEESVNAFVLKKKQLTLLYVHLTSLCASVLWAKLVEEHCYQVYSPTELRLPRH